MFPKFNADIVTLSPHLNDAVTQSTFALIDNSGRYLKCKTGDTIVKGSKLV